MSTNGHLSASELAPIAQGRLRKDAAAAWNAMNVESRRRGLELVPTGSMSSYRTYEQQQYLWDLYQSGKGNLAAHPGTSNHGWGVAVDVPTQAMRQMIDRIGAPFGFSKSWSDAPTEWWHIKFQEGHYHGTDPGPKGAQAAAPKPPPPAPPKQEDIVGVTCGTNEAGVFHVFVEAKDGSIWRTWQKPGGTAWRNGGKLELFAPAPEVKR